MQPPRTRMRSEERRAAIVACAARLFAEKGFRGVTTRELAAAVGVTEPVLYRHFATKRDLYTAIIEMKAGERDEIFGEVRALARKGDDQGFFSTLAERILRRAEEHPDFIRSLLFSALERHELAQMVYQRHMVRLYDLVAGYIRRRIQEGAFRPVDPRTAARAFIGMVGEHSTHEALFGRRMSARPGRKNLSDELAILFLNGIAGEKR
ncbi:MAG: TetR/AcrR family transcriptional regulator [Bryobacteraceae bacterium]